MFCFLLTPLLHESAILDKGEFTALQYAAKKNYIPLIKLVLEKGADVNYHRKDNEYKDTMRFGTALHWAVFNDREEVIELLLENGADIDAPAGIKRWGRVETPLDIAVAYGCEGVVKLLLERGASLVTNPYEQTPLLTKAAKGGHDGIVRMLLDEGVDINASLQGCEKTPLYQAVQSIRLTVVKLLLERGADMELRGPSWEGEMTPLEWAVRHNRWARSEKSLLLLKILQEGAAMREKAATEESVEPAI